MAKLEILSGTTSKLIQIYIQSTATGLGLTGLTSGSSGLSWYYYREGAASSTSVAPQAMTLGTWTTRGFIVVDGTNMPGVYQLGVPDAAIAAGAKSVVMLLFGVTNMAPVVLEIELTAVDNQNATSFGLTDLDATISSRLAASSYTAPPTAAANATAVWQDATAGDFTVSSSIGKSLYTSGVAPGGAGGLFIAGMNAATTITTSLTTTFTGNLTGTVATVTNLTNAPTNGDLTAAMKASVTAAVPTAAQNATELLDQAAGVEANLTVRQQLRLAAAALYGKAAGLSTTTVTFRDTNDTVDRITATVDTSGDRTAVTLNSS